MRIQKLKTEIRDGYERWKLLPWYIQIQIAVTIVWLPYILIGYWLTNKPWFGRRRSWRRILVGYGVAAIYGIILGITNAWLLLLPLFFWTYPAPLMILTGPFVEKSAIIEEHDER